MAIRRSDPPKEPGMNREDIEALINVIHERGIEEFELEQNGMRLRVVSARAATPMSPMYHYAAPPPTSVMMAPAPGPALSSPPPAAPAPPPPPSTPATSSTPGKGDAPEDANLRRITSPMVGTFYRSSSPGAKAFVEVGDKVDQDTVLCIIEAMKLMNEIKAEMRGTIRKILIENAKPVEYGQALFLIEPS